MPYYSIVDITVVTNIIWIYYRIIISVYSIVYTMIVHISFDIIFKS